MSAEVLTLHRMTTRFGVFDFGDDPLVATLDERFEDGDGYTIARLKGFGFFVPTGGDTVHEASECVSQVWELFKWLDGARGLALSPGFWQARDMLARALAAGGEP